MNSNMTDIVFDDIIDIHNFYKIIERFILLFNNFVWRLLIILCLLGIMTIYGLILGRMCSFFEGFRSSEGFQRPFNCLGRQCSLLLDAGCRPNRACLRCFRFY